MSQGINKSLNNHQPAWCGPTQFLQALAAALLLLLSTAAVAQFDSYSISGYHYAQFSSSDVASIDLYGSRNNKFAILIFLADTAAKDLPDAEQGSDGIIRFYYRRERLPAVIDQLRNESPLKLHYWTGTPGVDNSHIATLPAEPVGEGEW